VRGFVFAVRPLPPFFRAVSSAARNATRARTAAEASLRKAVE
jgi:hypothetical protein